MKKFFYSSLAVLSTALLVFSCAKESNVDEPQVKEPQVEEGIQVTINTGKPEVDILTKTEMYGGAPYWSVGDVIGVSNGDNSNADFNTAIVERATTASFTGTVAAAGDYYAYYPYTSNGVGTISEKQGAKVDLPANQNPTATSFDGAADVMVSKKFTVTGTTPTVNNLVFARLGAIVKIVLIDTEDVMTSQHPSMVSMTAESALAGRVLINMQDQCLEDPYYNASNTVTANYTSLTKYEINGTNATYLIVVPQTLTAGSTLTIAASTEGYSIEKNITIPSGGIALEAGKITTLNINLYSSHISASSGLSLPFNDSFSWQTETGSAAATFSSTPAIPSEKYSAQERVYQGSAAGVIKFGASSTVGYLTTVELDLSSAFYVHINAKGYNSKACRMTVTVDDGTPQSIDLTADYSDYYLNFAASTSKSKVKIATTNELAEYRSYLQQFDVISGTYVFPPAINVTSENPMDVANTASTQTITYEIVNPTAATLTAALKDPADTWITNIDFSTPGEVTFDVAAQGSGAPARDAVIVLSYTGAANVEVEVDQAAGAGAGPSKTVITYENFTNTSYNTNENSFTQDTYSFGYVNAMRNGSNGTPTGWAKNQVIQTKNTSSIYNKTSMGSISKIRVYTVANTNSFTITSGNSKNPTENSIIRPNTPTGSESITYSKYENKTVTDGQTTTANYYDFTISNKPYFKIAPGGSLYIYKIEITYSK